MRFPDLSNQKPRFFDDPASMRKLAGAYPRPRTAPEFRLVIIGSGMIGREHIRVAGLLGEAQVIGLYDSDAVSAKLGCEAVVAQWQSEPKLYGSIQEAVAEPFADAILICTPNFTHREVLDVAMASGKPIFLEKPMATTLADAAAIDVAARQYEARGAFIQLGMQYRFKAQYAEAFHRIKRAGAVGEIKTLSMAEHRPPFLDKVGQWNKFSANTGGTLVEKCCHYFDLINLMAEATPTRVYASGGQAVNFLDFEQGGQRADIHDHSFVVIDYDNGVRASFTLNMFAPELYEELRVVGNAGMLLAAESASFRPGVNSSCWIEQQRRDSEQPQRIDCNYAAAVEASGHYGATFFEHRALLARLRGETQDSASTEQGLWSIIVAAAAQESERSGQAVIIEQFLNEQGID